MSDKQQAIKQAAITLFSERGYDGTTVPIIAKEANVGAGTVYRYFDNKETLLNIIMQEQIMILEQSVRNSFPHHLTIRKQFEHLSIQLIQLCIAFRIPHANCIPHHKQTFKRKKSNSL